MTQPSPVAIERADPDSADARMLIGELAAELTRVTGHFTAWSYSPADAHLPRSTFVIARHRSDGQAVGCGAVRPIDDERADIAELKRMYARPGTHGVGHEILAHLEQFARECGYREMWLETGVQNERAIRFYERHGYRAIARFGPYVDRLDSICLGRQL